MLQDFLYIQSYQNFHPRFHDVIELLCCRAFLMLAGSREAAVQCRILRDKSSKLYPKYQLLLESGTSFLMSARKRKKSKSSNYILSFDEEDTARFSANFAGKVRANFLGTEFTVYDKGQKPQRAGRRSGPLHFLCTFLICTSFSHGQASGVCCFCNVLLLQSLLPGQHCDTCQFNASIFCCCQSVLA